MSFTVSYLRCEYLVNPEGLDERFPRLSWLMKSDRRGARQTAYRIRVGPTLDGATEHRALFWDSGRVESDVSAHVAYAGKPLASRDVCVWDVEVWDETGFSVRSTPARWSMGLLEKADWSDRKSVV